MITRPYASRRNATRHPTRAGKAFRLAALCLLGGAPLLLANNHVHAESLLEQAEGGDSVEPDEVDAYPPGPSISNLVFARMGENPVAGITRLPVLNFVNFGIPPKDRVAYSLVLAPIIPKVFKGGWGILTRTTIPAVVTVPFGPGQDPMRPVNVDDRTTGFGDMGFEVLGTKQLRGKKKQFYDLGLGPFVGAPSASDDFLGRGRWLVGPEIALGITARQWVTVLIARNEWSVGKNTNRADVNQLWMQYFLFYNLPKLFYLIYEPIITVNWERQPGDRATLPVGIGFGRHIRVPKRPRLGLTTRYSGFYNALRTDQGAKWQLVATLVFWKPNPLVFK
jgi:hypothetical protein